MGRKKLIQGVGVNDANYPITYYVTISGIRKRTMCPYYRKWTNMLSRCYCLRYQERQPTYKECSVTPEWFVFSVFKSWMESKSWKDGEGNVLQLDKDMYGFNKVYSPETCCFVSSKVNKFLGNGGYSGEIGVPYCERLSKYIPMCCNPFDPKDRGGLGCFVDKGSAKNAWVGRKLKYLDMFLVKGEVDAGLYDVIKSYLESKRY